MKRKVTQWLGAGLLTLSVMACNKDDETAPGGNMMKATVDGAVINCNLAVQATYSSNVLSLGGRTSDAKGFSIAIPNYTGTTGNITLSTNQFLTAVVNLSTATTDIYTASLAAGTATVNISSFTNEKVVGTFEFTGRNNASGTKAVTAGSFDIKR